MDGKIVCSSDGEDACLEAIGAAFADASFVTVYTGAEIDDARAEKAVALLKSKLGSMAEIAVVPGGQPIYDYIVSAE